MPLILQSLWQLLVYPDASDPFHEPLAMLYNRSLDKHGEQPPPELDTPYRVLVRKAVLEHASTPAAELMEQIHGVGLGVGAVGRKTPPPSPQPTLSQAPTASTAPTAPTAARLPDTAASSSQERAVRAALSSRHLESYTEALMRNGFDRLEDLYALTAEELREAASLVGMPKGHEIKFIRLFGAGAGSSTEEGTPPQQSAVPIGPTTPGGVATVSEPPAGPSGSKGTDHKSHGKGAVGRGGRGGPPGRGGRARGGRGGRGSHAFSEA